MIPIFIGGTGRSGTTILKHVLRCHPQIASIPIELRVIVDPGGALDLYTTLTDRWSPYQADYALHTFRRMLVTCAPRTRLPRVFAMLLDRIGIAPRRYAKMDLGRLFGREFYLERLEQLINQISYHVSRGRWIGSPSYQIPGRIFEADYYESTEIAAILAEFFHDLFRHKSENRHQTHWIDDTPYNFVHAGDLLKLFPNMRFIHIYRDLRDVLVSHLKFGWGGDDLAASARRLSNLMKRWFEVRKLLPVSTYMEVSLEALASAREVQIDKICQFAGLEYDNRLDEGLSRLTRGKVHTGRWRTELPQDKLEAIMPYLSPFLEAYGYDLSK